MGTYLGRMTAVSISVKTLYQDDNDNNKYDNDDKDRRQ